MKTAAVALGEAGEPCLSALPGIDHFRAKANNPQTNGICERFHKTLPDECYSLLFRNKPHRGLEELQTDLDAWLEKYKRKRPIRAVTATGRPLGRPCKQVNS